MVYNDRAYGGATPAGMSSCGIKCWTFLPPAPVNGVPGYVPLAILALAKQMWLRRHVYHGSVYSDIPVTRDYGPGWGYEHDVV